jgi:hypothetical protein
LIYCQTLAACLFAAREIGNLEEEEEEEEEVKGAPAD